MSLIAGYSPQYRSLPSSLSASTTDMKSRATKAVPMNSPVLLPGAPAQELAFSLPCAQTLPRATSDALTPMSGNCKRANCASVGVS